MAKYTVSHFCGHDVVHQLFGPHKERDRKIAWLEGQSCAECRKIEFNAGNAEAAAKVADGDLPQLRGSEKQINWARTVRAPKAAEIRTLIEKGVTHNREKGDHETANLIERAGFRVLDRADARYWIDSRERDAKGLLRDEMDAIREQGGAA